MRKVNEKKKKKKKKKKKNIINYFFSFSEKIFRIIFNNYIN